LVEQGFLVNEIFNLITQMNTFIQMREKPRLFRAGMDSAAAIAAFGIS